ncbi:MAG: YkgJ family cysteine cluster protein [Bacteroidia bacterium]
MRTDISVLKKSPCPFLLDDNHCSIYSIRPQACREYPHTIRKNIYFRLWI